MNSSKLVLGTVQFGQDYGINNTSGKITKEEVFKILDFASKQGITTLDTAHTYGDSEEVIGSYIQKSGQKFNIISKIPKLNKEESIEQYLEESLWKLKTDSLYAYLFHDFNSYRDNPDILSELQELKGAGKIKKIGFSLYFPTELDYLLSNQIEFDIVQIPYSVFDQRFERYFEQLQKEGKEVHVRSVFLQGLVFKKPEDLSKHFLAIKEKLQVLNNISEDSGVKVSSLCLNFALLNSNISRVVIGVDSLANLQENISDISDGDIAKKYISNLAVLKTDDESIILPINWSK